MHKKIYMAKKCIPAHPCWLSIIVEVEAFQKKTVLFSLNSWHQLAPLQDPTISHFSNVASKKTKKTRRQRRKHSRELFPKKTAHLHPVCTHEFDAPFFVKQKNTNGSFGSNLRFNHLRDVSQASRTTGILKKHSSNWCFFNWGTNISEQKDVQNRMEQNHTQQKFEVRNII